MINHKLFAKGAKIHALISTTQKPNVLFPVRAIIYDVKFDDINPQYQIKVIKFYDQIYFLKQNLFGGRFIKDFEGHDTKINLKREHYSKVSQLEEDVFSGPNWEKYKIIVDSVFCTQTRAEQEELFNKIQSFHIELKLKELYELTNRTVYSKGQYYFHTKGEYVKAIEKFLGDRYPKEKGWVDDLLYRPETSEMDGAEWV
jgi:hypothetical protein